MLLAFLLQIYNIKINTLPLMITILILWKLIPHLNWSHGFIFSLHQLFQRLSPVSLTAIIIIWTFKKWTIDCCSIWKLSFSTTVFLGQDLSVDASSKITIRGSLKLDLISCLVSEKCSLWQQIICCNVMSWLYVPLLSCYPINNFYEKVI